MLSDITNISKSRVLPNDNNKRIDTSMKAKSTDVLSKKHQNPESKKMKKKYHKNDGRFDDAEESDDESIQEFKRHVIT